MARMHQTTLRFSPDLWAALEAEAAQVGVSVAQFVRDAALTRLAFAQGVQRGRSREQVRSQVSATWPHLASRIEAQLSSADAVRAQAQLARDRAQRIRAEADRARGRATGARNR